MFHTISSKCGLTKERIQRRKQDHGYQLHSNGHIHDVQIAELRAIWYMSGINVFQKLDSLEIPTDYRFFWTVQGRYIQQNVVVLGKFSFLLQSAQALQVFAFRRMNNGHSMS
ncbi:hypothetical protein KUTeg_017790 [Tegillarca granosa]|uniref:Uncharacterized protein n=1 Tax=Tegillarca granosa TaxID=220873 RepID=A0ABQ9EFY5_TEGGR|nr:hypothetical protein KUTeg_017790 [Tegillarca granosa]